MKGKPKSNVFTGKIQPKDQYKQAECFLFLPFIGTVSNDVADPKPEKRAENKAEKSSLKVKK